MFGLQEIFHLAHFWHVLDESNNRTSIQARSKAHNVLPSTIRLISKAITINQSILKQDIQTDETPGYGHDST